MTCTCECHDSTVGYNDPELHCMDCGLDAAIKRRFGN